MKYCIECGTKLILKECFNCGISEGMILYCEKCKDFRFPNFNVAVSMVIYNYDFSKVLLIKQYNKNQNILVAGYVSKGENLEETLNRELKEEVGIIPEIYFYNDSKYYNKSNTLICNFIVKAKTENLVLNNEIDFAFWYSLGDAKNLILKNSLAEYFFNLSLEKIKKF